MKYKLNNWEWGVRSEEWGCCDWQNTASVRPYAPGRAVPGGRRRRWVQSPVKWQPSGGVHQYSTQYTVHSSTPVQSVQDSDVIVITQTESDVWGSEVAGCMTRIPRELSRTQQSVASGAEPSVPTQLRDFITDFWSSWAPWSCSTVPFY